jgi:hypothetical protein
VIRAACCEGEHVWLLDQDLALYALAYHELCTDFSELFQSRYYFLEESYLYILCANNTLDLGGVLKHNASQPAGAFQCSSAFLHDSRPTSCCFV